MKKFGAPFLVLLALAHLAGVMPLSLYFMQEVKTEARIRLSDATGLAKVMVQGKEYNDPRVFQLMDEDEFTYRGRMYDFKSVTREGNDYIFYAAEDDKETNLLSFLNGVFEQTSDRCGDTKMPVNNPIKNFEKDFFHNWSSHVLSALQVHCFRLMPDDSGVFDCHLNVIFHPPA